MDQQQSERPEKKGYIVLISVMIAAAIALAVGVSLILWGTEFTKTGLTLEQSNQARGLANACAEEALQQIQDSSGFSGTATINLGQGSCTYTVANLGGTSRSVTASGTVGAVVRKVQISIDQVNPNVTVTSWQEVAAF